MNKQELRYWAKEKRKNLNIKQLSVLLARKLVELSEYKQAKNIMIFYPLENEIDLLSLLKDKTKHFYLPKIKDKELLCCPYKEGDDTCLSCFNTCEPLTEECKKSLIDLVIIPALAVDKNNYRLGYGGGFYDRFLKDFEGKKIVCIPKELIIETIYPDEFDIPADIVITA